jgi:hypothetical protein
MEKNLKKTSVITFYNKTKGGVDTTDQLCASKNVSRNVRRWPMVIFFAMLNISGTNAQILYFGIAQPVVRRKVFLKRLSHELVMPQLILRSEQKRGLPKELSDSLYRFITIAVLEQSQDKIRNENKRKRCHTRTQNKRLTRYSCQQCHQPICLTHLKSYCGNCVKTVPGFDVQNNMVEHDD